MNLEIFLQTIVSGLFTRSIYALVAIGLTLIYGVMIILNFALGEILMSGIHPYLSIPIAAILGFALGAFIQRGLVQRVLDAHLLNQIILLLGVSTLMIGLVQFFGRPNPGRSMGSMNRKCLFFRGRGSASRGRLPLFQPWSVLCPCICS